MKLIITALLSLAFCVSRAQFKAFDLPGEIVKIGRTMVERHAIAQADTCVPKADLKAAKTYVEYLERNLEKSQAENALLRFQVGQRGERIGSLESSSERLETQNLELESSLREFQQNRRMNGWVCAGLGALGAVLIGVAIGR
jgi:chromosome segregation ATPase